MLGKEKLIIVIGRGHGGTRLISETLSRSGVYMGTTNESGDLVPAQDMYSAVKMAGSLVSMAGKHSWDFTRLLSKEPPARFVSLVNSYLENIMLHDGKNVGWKLPETLLAFPWIAKMFPNAYYIYWTRDIRDSISGEHLTDNIRKFGVKNKINPKGNSPAEMTAAIMESRIESWIYQRLIIEATPKPQKFLEVKFEDFVLQQETTLAKISTFLGIPLASVCVVDRSEEMCSQWKIYFKDCEDVFVYHGDIFHLKTDCIVSPANSFGFMDGGIDLLISKKLGWHIQERLQNRIKAKSLGEILVGEAELIDTLNKEIPFCISAPTMRVPMIIKDTVNVYLASKAIFNVLKWANGISSVTICGLGTGVGQVPFDICAKQMKQAYSDIWVKGKYEFPLDWSESQVRHQLLYSNFHRDLQY